MNQTHKILFNFEFICLVKKIEKLQFYVEGK